MPRSKVNVAYISNDSTRRTTFKKRESGLIKKIEEITTLCAVEACAIIFSPYKPEPKVWPSPLEAQRVISRFRNMAPPEQNRKMVDQQSFASQRLEKTAEKVTKLVKDNQHEEMTQVMYQCLSGTREFECLTIADLNYMSGLISQNLRVIDRRMEFYRRHHSG